MIRKILLLIIIFEEYSGEEYNNSDAIRSIIAVTASHKLISDIDKGKINQFPTLNEIKHYINTKVTRRKGLLLDNDSFT